MPRQVFEGVYKTLLALKANEHIITCSRWIWVKKKHLAVLSVIFLTISSEKDYPLLRFSKSRLQLNSKRNYILRDWTLLISSTYQSALSTLKIGCGLASSTDNPFQFLYSRVWKLEIIAEDGEGQALQSECYNF